MAYHPNAGSLPSACVIADDQGNVTSYRKVHVRLRQGYDTRKVGAAPWPSGGSRPPTRWSLSKSAFDIIEYEVV